MQGSAMQPTAPQNAEKQLPVNAVVCLAEVNKCAVQGLLSCSCRVHEVP